MSSLSRSGGLPPFWSNASRILLVRDGDAFTLNGPALYVFLTKGIVVGNGTELHRHHGQRDWRNKAAADFGDGPLALEAMSTLAMKLNHG